MRSLGQWGIRNPVPTNLFMITLLVLGLASMFILRREMFPQFQVDRVSVTVTTETPSTADQVDRNIIQIIQPRIQPINGVKEIRTTATEQSARFDIDIIQGYNAKKVKDDIADEIDSITTLPDEALEPRVILLEHFERALQINIVGEGATDLQMREVADWVKNDIKERGLATRVAVRSPARLELAIHVPIKSLEAKGLTIQNLAQQIQSYNVESTAGEIRTEERTIVIKGEGRRITPQEVANIPVRFPNGEFLRLVEITGYEGIVDGFSEDPLIQENNGHRAIFVSVERSENEDIIDLADGLRAYVEETVLPYGLQMDLGLDMSVYIRDRLALITKNGLTGLVLVVLVLSLFLDWQVAFWASVGIAFSLIGTFACLYLLGGTINMLTLFGFLIAIGIVVDDAIVVGEAFFQNRQIGKSAAKAASDALKEVSMPVVAMMLTTIVAFVPLLAVQGLFGEFMKIIPVAVMSALLLSLIESLFILPAHLAHHSGDRETLFMKVTHAILWPIIAVTSRIQPKVNQGLEALTSKAFIPFMRIAIHHRYATVVFFLSIMIFFFGLIPAGIVKTSLFPKPDAELHIAQIEFERGTPIAKTESVVREIIGAFQEAADHFAERDGINPVKDYYLIVGDPAEHRAEMILELIPADQGRKVSGQEFLDGWRSRIPPNPDLLSLDIQSAGAGPPAKAIEVWLTSRNELQLAQTERAIKKYLLDIEGVVNFVSSNRPGSPTVEVRLREEFADLPVSEQDLIRTLTNNYQGYKVDTFYRGDNEVKMYLRAQKQDRTTLTDLKDIVLPSGLRVGQVADLTTSRDPAEITRIDGARTTKVGAEVDLTSGANSADIRSKLENEFLSKVRERWPDVRWAYSGESKEGNEAVNSMIAGYVPALMAIYAILATLFRSYTQPIIIMLAIPFSFLGALIGHMVMGIPFNLMSGFGIIALTGIAVNDSLVLIDLINVKVREGMDVMDSLVFAVTRRFRPIILTSLTTIAGLSPILLETSFQAQFLIPLVTSIVFGVLFATVLILLLIPVGYRILLDVLALIHRLLQGEVKIEDLVREKAIE